MDKSNRRTYCLENQLLTVERHFTGEKSIEEIVKQYLSEQMEKMWGIDAAAATAAKEDGK